MKRVPLFLSVVLAATIPVVAAAQKTRGTGKAIFSSAQASEGEGVYAANCAMCHGALLDGTLEIPGLKGKFMANWAGRPVGDLYTYVAKAMPQPAPGSLSDADNARLVAFLLRENGLPGGSAPLPVDRAVLGRIVLASTPPR